MRLKKRDLLLLFVTLILFVLTLFSFFLKTSKDENKISKNFDNGVCIKSNHKTTDTLKSRLSIDISKTINCSYNKNATLNVYYLNNKNHATKLFKELDLNKYKYDSKINFVKIKNNHVFVFANAKENDVKKILNLF